MGKAKRTSKPKPVCAFRKWLGRIVMNFPRPDQKILLKVNDRVSKGSYQAFGKKPGDRLKAIYRACVARMRLPRSGRPLHLMDGTPLARTYTRVVYGHYGPYVEIPRDAMVAALKVPKSQRWRLSKKVQERTFMPLKYTWHEIELRHGTKAKVYFQLRTVKYADYKVGFYYIHPMYIRSV